MAAPCSSLSASAAERRAAWSLPAGVHVALIDSESQLEGCRPLLEAAVCCGIDAEWPPEETTQEERSGGGSGPPHATLVQLALWLPPGGCPLPPAVSASQRDLAGQRRQGSSSGESGGAGSSSNGSGGPVGSSSNEDSCCCVLLLDMLSLPLPEAKHALQAVFRDKGCLKLGFGLVHDLRAIAAALGGEGGSCIAVIEPACDLGTLHRFLRHRRAPGANKSIDLGLSGLVEAQLGLPLDKQLQCSAWGKRPLSAAQQQYAAADAACLLALLGSLVAGVGQPQEWLMDTAAVAGAPGGGDTSATAVAPGGGDTSAATGAPGGDGTSPISVVEAAAAALEAPPAPADAAPAQLRQAEMRPLSSPPPQQQPQAAAGAGAGAGALLGACSLQQLRAAAAAWGARLEISGARAVKRSSKRGSKAARQQRQAAAGAQARGAGFPSHVPWLDAQQQVSGPIRFLCDIMAEGLARQLRLCGFDAESLSSMEKAPRHVIYRVMVERAEGEQRVVLTRDRTFITANYSDQAFFVQRDTKREQLEEVLHAFGLRMHREDLLSRCARCNGQFLPDPVPAALLPPGHDMPPAIQQQHPEFWVCGRCSGVFWQGRQYGRAVRRMTDLMSKLTLPSSSSSGGGGGDDRSSGGGSNEEAGSR